MPDLAWRQVSVTSRECLGSSRCPQGEDCFAEQARRKAQKVDVVVTNHAMLAIDALSEVSILPEHDVVIIDEAHELDGRITAVATADLSVTALTLAAKRAGKLGGTKDHDVKVTRPCQGTRRRPGYLQRRPLDNPPRAGATPAARAYRRPDVPAVCHCHRPGWRGNQ